MAIQLSALHIGAVIVGFLFTEMLIHVVLNRPYYFLTINEWVRDTYGERSNENIKCIIIDSREKVEEDSNTFQSRAITLSGLSLAIGSFIISTGENSAQEIVIFLIGLSILLLFISSQAKKLTTSRRLYLLVQEKTLEYGFITLIIATLWFFQREVPALTLLIIAGIIIIITLRGILVLHNLYIDYKM